MEFSICQDESCSFCCDINGFVIDSIPRPEPDSKTGKYKSYAETSRENCTIDDFQLRKRCKDMFDAGKLKSTNHDEIQKFAKDYRVPVDLVRGHICHLENLKLKRDKRSKEAKEKKEQRKANLANQFEETETDEEYQEFDSEEEREADEDENFILNQDGDDESDEEELMFVPNIRTATGGRHSDESSDDSDSSDESNGSESDSSEHGETSSERDGSGSDTEMVKYETTNRFGRKVSVLRTTNITCSISDKLNI